MFMMSLSVWMPARERVRVTHELVRNPRFALPALATVASIGIVMLGNFAHISVVAISLAAATLAVVGVRMVMSLRILSRLTEARVTQAVTDELTGLGNRRLLLSEIDQRMTTSALTSRPSFALLLIDLDHFKEINDSFGHPAGDAVLREIAPRFKSAVRSIDSVARLGGDEFAVVLEQADLSLAVQVAERITTSLEEAVVLETTSLHVGASIGIALAPTHATSTDELVRCADVAMYRAKGLHLAFDTYEAALDEGADRLMLMEDLRTATEDGSLALHYQPEIDLQTGEVVACEALLRWSHPRLGSVPPEHFLSLAEECGLTSQITSWVLDEAIRACAHWRARGHQAAVAVNLLATDLLDESFPAQVFGRL